MTQKDLASLIERNRLVESVPTETGIAAGLKLAEIAEVDDIQWAFIGGMAMHIYGYVRATTDVDMIADRLLSLDSKKKLSFGGESYLVEVGDKVITVDWIVRNDDAAKFYQAALAEALKIPNGIRIIPPEWMVIIKHLAGRPKDQLDLIWLLQESDLVSREKVISNIEKVLGEYAIYLIKDLQSEFDYVDLLRMRGERNKYE